MDAMIRIAISPAAFDAIAATLPLRGVGYEPRLDALHSGSTLPTRRNETAWMQLSLRTDVQ
jgi:hypothetical protein